MCPSGTMRNTAVQGGFGDMLLDVPNDIARLFIMKQIATKDASGRAV